MRVNTVVRLKDERRNDHISGLHGHLWVYQKHGADVVLGFFRSIATGHVDEYFYSRFEVVKDV
jgi:hypothetical protein